MQLLFSKQLRNPNATIEIKKKIKMLALQALAALNFCDEIFAMDYCDEFFSAMEIILQLH